MLTRATFYVLITVGNIVIGFGKHCVERDEVAAGRKCGQACQSDGTCTKQNRECVCSGLCGLTCLRKRSIRQCPERDEVAAGRKCGQACQSDGTCTKQNRDCVCSGLCGLTCLRKKCPPLTYPRNGNLTITPNDRTIGAEATYVCNTGYVISGLRNRRCQTNKTWSGTQPTCTHATTEASTLECLPRDEEAAGRRCKKACLQDGTCKQKNKECVCDGLCGLSCLRKRCPTLTAPLNGKIVVNPNDRTIGAEVTYSCNDGYVISGQTNRICQANKTWSGTEPMCTLLDSTTEVPFDHEALGNGDVTYTIGDQGHAFCVRIDDDNPFVGLCGIGTWTLEPPPDLPPLPSFSCC